uniref:Uncharacterized protein n=1 Tax=Ciona intestinalis TaxID=7719 RepID=H2Y022_CIOIN
MLVMKAVYLQFHFLLQMATNFKTEVQLLLFIGLLDVYDTEYAYKSVIVMDFACCGRGRITSKMMKKSALILMQFWTSCSGTRQRVCPY